MIRQNLLPFRLEMTKDMITFHAGLSLFGEFAVGLGILKTVDKYLPKPGSGAGYEADIINYCEKEGIEFAIGGDLDAAVLKVINNIPEEDWRTYKGGYIAEAIHTMNKTENSFRLIVICRPYQQNMFEEEGEKVKYTVIVTNKLEPAERVVWWYNQRGDCSENRIKDILGE